MKLEQKLLISYFSARLNMIGLISKRKAAETAFELFCTPIRKPKRTVPPIFLIAEPIHFDAAGYTIHGYCWPKAHAKKILIVHGFESSSLNFEKYVNGLLSKGYEVTAFDAPAHGKSSGKTINLPAYVAVMDQIQALYGPFDGFLAHSYGGLAVSHFLEKTPHTSHTRAVFIAPATETTTTIDSFFSYLKLGKDIRREFDHVIFERGGRWPDYYSIRRAMHAICANILWFHDEDDELTPLSDALKIRDERYPHVRFRISKGLGHSRIYRDIGVLQETLKFFDQ